MAKAMATEAYHPTLMCDLAIAGLSREWRDVLRCRCEAGEAESRKTLYNLGIQKNRRSDFSHEEVVRAPERGLDDRLWPC